MTIGVVMPARFPIRLNNPPLSPTMSFGDVSEITVHPKAPKPLPKKASDIHRMTSHCAREWLQAIIVMESNIPVTIGSFLEKVREYPARSSLSDTTPPRTPPTEP